MFSRDNNKEKNRPANTQSSRFMAGCSLLNRGQQRNKSNCWGPCLGCRDCETLASSVNTSKIKKQDQ